VVKLEKPFIDARGNIQPLVDEMMRSAVMIESKAGSIRANHFHKTDWHYCYVISGQLEYLHRPTGSDAEPAVIVVDEGEMVFTPPLVDHGMRFPVPDAGAQPARPSHLRSRRGTCRFRSHRGLDLVEARRGAIARRG